MSFVDRERVEVRHAWKWWRTSVDCCEKTNAPYGWILVAGIPGRAGPFAVPVSDVRRMS